MRIAVIGCGSIGARHARNLKALGHEVVPVDSDHQKAAGLTYELGENGWSEELRAFDGLDAVMICTPAHVHTSVLLQLRDAGYAGPLFVEKPICDTWADVRHWRAWPHPVVMVGYNLRWQPQACALRIGLTRSGVATAARFGLVCNMSDWPGHSYGDPILECSHEIDLAIWCGAPEELSAVEITRDWAKLEFGDADHRVDLCWTAESPRYRRMWSVESERFHGSAWFDSPEALGNQMYVDELAHFLRAVEGGPIAPGCTLEEGIAVLDVVRQVKELVVLAD